MLQPDVWLHPLPPKPLERGELLALLYCWASRPHQHSSTVLFVNLRSC
jgi:hypothetical protein